MCSIAVWTMEEAAASAFRRRERLWSERQEGEKKEGECALDVRTSARVASDGDPLGIRHFRLC